MPRLNSIDHSHGLHYLISAILAADPDFPPLMAVPSLSPEDFSPVAFLVAINLKVLHDPVIVQHMKALIQRMIAIDPSMPPEQKQIMEDAIAAFKCKEREAEVKFL